MGAILVQAVLAGCGPSAAELEAVDYAPPPNDEWLELTPEEQGLDPQLVAELYHSASELETVYSVLVVKNVYSSLAGE